MNKKKPKLKSLRSDANISYVGPIKAAWRSHVIPTVRDVLQVVFNGQVALKLPITKSINRVAENVVSVQIPGAKPKSKSEIIRALKKIYGEWQTLQRSRTRHAEKYVIQRQAFQAKLDSPFDCMVHTSQVAQPQKRKFVARSADDRFTPEPRNKRLRKKSHPRKLNLITPGVAAALERTGTSNRNAELIFNALIEENHMKKEGTSSYATNHNTIRKTRQSKVAKMANEIKQSFKPNVLLTVHWDGKLIPNCITKQKEDRLPILVTGDGVSKLLAVPALASGKSALEAEAIVNAISDWELEDKVIAMCFDTTNTNSGIHKGVITRLPKMLNKKLLALACRHHVAEIVLRHLFEVYGDNSQSDQLDGFKKFKTDYNKKLESGEIMIPKTVTDDAKLDALTAPWRNGIIDFCLQQIELKHPRSDYLELLELALSFLGFKSTSIKLRKAGSLSRARWLGRAIYVLKSWMLQSYFDLFDEDLIAHYEKLSIFICKVYVQYWFSLNDPISSPRIDLAFWKSLRCFDYEAYAEAAVTAFNNHLWYVSPRNVALAFFDDNIPNSEREGMRDVFVSKAMRKTKRGKRPAVLCKAANVDQTFTIASFITQDTKEFFEIMQIDTNFLETPVEDWNTDENYINGKKRCAALVVVNDVAERAVKLISDFNDKSTKDSKQQQYLLQVVEYHRKNHPMKY